MWTVEIKKKTVKNLDRLPNNIKQLFFLLLEDLKEAGPVQPTWMNYSKLGDGDYHCHLNYRYVACWKANKELITIKVYYAGTRENAPY
jgi:mRNA-degrading endonuclease RelE of RelBE toxin-antitoxin system